MPVFKRPLTRSSSDPLRKRQKQSDETFEKSGDGGDDEHEESSCEEQEGMHPHTRSTSASTTPEDWIDGLRRVTRAVLTATSNAPSG